MKPILQIIAIALLPLAFSCQKESLHKMQVTAAQKEMNIAAAHYIGEPFGGGIIFSLDDSGTHGLIVSKEQALATWWNGSYIETFATGTQIGTGAANTKKIIRAQGRGSKYAALICAGYTVDGYSDWYLPSIAELFELYTQKNIIGGFANAPYWSSTEKDQTSAWYQNFSLGNQFAGSKDGAGYVRAIRNF